MSKKVYLVCGTSWDHMSFEAPSVQKVFSDWAEKYDLEFKLVDDTSLVKNEAEQAEKILKIEKNGPEFLEYSQEYLDEVADADILIVGFAGVSSKLVENCKNLKLVAVMRSGVENVNIEACKAKGICVCNAPGRLQEMVSDFACALILDINRGVTYVNTQYKGEKIYPYFMPELLKDITLGIVGFGYIGQLVARKLSGFNMKMIAYDPFVKKEIADKYNVELVDLPTLMSTADTITIHSRLLPETEKMISADMIKLMKPNAFFINTARAGLEDEEALIEALKEKKIRGAALDVTTIEPVPSDHVLRTLDNVILTPHMAGMAGDSNKISAEIIVEQVSMFLDGKTPTSAK